MITLQQKHANVFTLNIGTPLLLTILILEFEQSILLPGVESKNWCMSG